VSQSRVPLRAHPSRLGRAHVLIDVS
jgi:hypothetical protein